MKIKVNWKYTLLLRSEEYVIYEYCGESTYPNSKEIKADDYVRGAIEVYCMEADMLICRVDRMCDNEFSYAAKGTENIIADMVFSTIEAEYLKSSIFPEKGSGEMLLD